MSVYAHAVTNCFASTTIAYANTSAPIDTRGADILIAATVSYTGYMTVQDVGGPANQWQVMSTSGDTTQYITVAVAVNPQTSATHQFRNLPGSGTYNGAIVLACSGITHYDPFVASTWFFGNGGSSTSTCQTDTPIAPAEQGDLAITIFGAAGPNAGPTGVRMSHNDRSFAHATILMNSGVASAHVALAWKNATDTKPFRPMWTATSGTGWVCANVVLKAPRVVPASASNPFIRTRVGNGYQGYAGDGGSPTAATLNWPSEMIWVSDMVLVFVDNQNNVVRMVNFDSVPHTYYAVTVAPNAIQTIAGTGTQTCTGNGGPALRATLSHPVGLAMDSVGNLYVADQQCATIDKIDVKGIFSWVAGGGPRGIKNPNCGGPGHPYHGRLMNVPATQALLNCPQGVAIDSHGNIIVADSGNNRVAIVNTQVSTQTLYGVSIPSGYIEVIAGTGQNACTKSSSTPSPALAAVFQDPLGMATDSSDNIYFGGSCSVVFKVTTNGKITTVVGSGKTGYSPDGTPALSANLSGGVFRAAIEPKTGSLWFTDTWNGVLRCVDSNNNLRTPVGNYLRFRKNVYQGGGWYGENWSANLAPLNYPIGFIFHPRTGALWVSSLMSNVILETYTATNYAASRGSCQAAGPQAGDRGWRRSRGMRRRAAA